MRVIIAGSRNIQDLATVEAAITASAFRVTEVVSGTARGVDQLGERWAIVRGIPVTRFPADWRIGRQAGYLRNLEMVKYAAVGQGGLVAVWDGVSPGTRHTIQLAREHGIPVYVNRMEGA